MNWRQRLGAFIGGFDAGVSICIQNLKPVSCPTLYDDGQIAPKNVFDRSEGQRCLVAGGTQQASNNLGLRIMFVKNPRLIA